MAWKIYKNRIRCLKCKDIIESKHRHDYVSCKCGACSVDGGHDYLKRVGDFLDIQDLSISKWVSTTDFEDSSDSENPYHIPEYLFSTDEPKRTGTYLVCIQNDSDNGTEFELASYFHANKSTEDSLAGWFASGKVSSWVALESAFPDNIPDDKRTLTFNEVITSLSLYREKLLQDPVNYGKVVSKLIKCIFVDSDGYVNIKFFDDEDPLIIDKKGHIAKLK